MENTHVLSSDSLASIKAFINGAISQWLGDWSLGDMNFTLGVAYKQVINIKNYKTFTSENLVILVNDNNFSWQQVIFADALLELPESARFSDISKSAKTDLIGALSKGREWCVAEPYNPAKSYNSYLAINICLQGEEKLNVLIPAHCVFKLFGLETKTASKHPLTKRVELLQTKSCELAVKLEFGSFSIAELSNLTVGSLLCPEIQLDNKFLLESNNVKLADVAIGRISDRKVFMISGDKK